MHALSKIGKIYIFLPDSWWLNQISESWWWGERGRESVYAGDKIQVTERVEFMRMKEVGRERFSL